MIYREVDFFAIVWFGSSSTPSHRLSRSVCRRSSLLTRERGRGWGRSQIIRRRESLLHCSIHSGFSSSFYFFGDAYPTVQVFALWIRIKDTPGCSFFCDHILPRFMFHLEKPGSIKEHWCLNRPSFLIQIWRTFWIPRSFSYRTTGIDSSLI